MGCCNSKNEADVSAVNVTLKNENTDMTKKASVDALSSTRESMQSQEKKKDSQPPQPSSPKKAPAPKPPEDKQAAEQAKKEDDFDKWAHMEEAEEKSFLASEEDTKEIDEALEKEFPGVSQRRSQYADVATWQDLVAEIPVEESDFELLPPFTLEKASAFYKHLCMPDARRRNEKRADSLPSISRRSVYEVVVAAFALYTEKAEKEGALQSVPAPTSKHERLRVCGDTHGQLNDVLWIFDEHGEPSPTNAYLFNGDIADRGSHALDIFLLLLTYQLADPRCMYINRGNHEQRDLNERPFSAGGGFCWELRAKYPHDENLVDLFHRFFNTMPVASIVGQWALVIHGGLFREPSITLDDIRQINFRRNPPQQLQSKDDNMLFDALWADPHKGNGVIIGTPRGAFSATFGADVTKAFCARNGIKSVVRSHQLPDRQRGFEIMHDAMLLTIFSASNYGGACRNKGGVLVFDEQGPAEVKEFYAPELEQLRAMCEFRAVEKVKAQISGWRAAAMAGKDDREVRRQQRDRRGLADSGWKHLILKVDELGQLDDDDATLVGELPKRWDSMDEETLKKAQEEGEKKSSGPRAAPEDVADRKAIRRRTLVDHLLRPDDVKKRAADAAAQATNGKSAKKAAQVAGLPQGDVVSGVVYVEEESQSAQTDHDIFVSMLDELVKHKLVLASAFVDAEAKEAPAGAASLEKRRSNGNDNRAVLARRSSELHSVSYESWISVLKAEIPEYASLWTTYGPRLLGSAAVPPNATSTANLRVDYVAWLNRFHVRLVYETYDAFSNSMLERLYNRLLARTRTMPMSELFAYFDPDHDGSTEPQELIKALRTLELGLSTPQLESLAMNMGFQAGEQVEPMHAITLLLECIGPSIREGLRRSKRQGLRQSAVDEASERTLAANDAKLKRLGALMRQNMAKTTNTLCSKTVKAIFEKADSDGNGVLSREEAGALLMELQAAVGSGEKVVKGKAECESLASHVDIDGNGMISFIEFLVGFGLSDDGASQPAAAKEALAASQAKKPDIVQGVCRNICGALYERIHGLARAFAYLDVEGDGWIDAKDFEQAILLVMRHVAPRDKGATRKKYGLDGEGLVVDASCVTQLVASLEGSSLTDGKSPPRIDCYAFIQAFEPCDSEGLLQ